MAEVTGDLLATQPRAVSRTDWRSAALAKAAEVAWIPALGMWCALVASAIPLHEPWFDEAQAWLLARDSSLPELFSRMSYEGTPPLWHLLLFPLAKLGAPYASMQVVAATSAGIAAYLVMRHAPWPLPIRLLLPFGYFGLYQYAVVARNYSLLMPLVFAAAILYGHRRDRPGPLVTVLILLGMTALHGYLLAAGILAAHVLELRREWPRLPARLRRRQARAMAAFAAYTALLVPLLWPQPDYGGFVPSHPFTPRALLGVAGWMIDGAFASQAAVTVAVLAVSGWWFHRTRTLALFLLPVAGLLLLFLAVHANWWHQGVVFLAWAFALWRSYAGRSAARPSLPMTCAALLLLAFQVPAAARTLRADAAREYSGSRAAASYIASHHVDGIFASGFATPAVLPYLPMNPFINGDLGPSRGFYSWTARARLLQDDEHLRRARPKYVLVSTKFEKRRLPLRGYRVVVRFPGQLLWKGEAIEDDSYVLLRRR